MRFFILCDAMCNKDLLIMRAKVHKMCIKCAKIRHFTQWIINVFRCFFLISVRLNVFYLQLSFYTKQIRSKSQCKCVIRYRWCDIVENLVKITFIALKISDCANLMQNFDEMHIVRNAVRSRWWIKVLSLFKLQFVAMNSIKNKWIIGNVAPFLVMACNGTYLLLTLLPANRKKLVQINTSIVLQGK